MEAAYQPISITLDNKKPTMSVSRLLLKLRLVIWKNWIIRIRHWFLTICEIGVPLILFILVAYARSEMTNAMGKRHIDTPTYDDIRTSDLIYKTKFPMYDINIFYCPKNGFVENLFDKVRVKLNINNDVLRGFDNENELLTFYKEVGANKSTTIGIVFKGIDSADPPTKFNYDIRFGEKYNRWSTESLFFAYMTGYSNGYVASEAYLYQGFIALQMALDTSYIELATKSEELPVDIAMQAFPYPPYLQDIGVSEMYKYILPLITVFSFVLLCPVVIKRVVEEKSTGIKELMKMMGLKGWMLWLGWFIHAFAANFLTVCAIVIIMKTKLFGSDYPPIEFCDASVLLVFLLLYCAASITYCFAISSLFNRPTIAMIVGILAWILSYSVPKSIVDENDSMKWGKKILFALMPNMGLDFGYKFISVYEMREVSTSWGNIFKYASGSNEDVTMGNVFVMFIVDIIVYTAITMYMDKVKPGPYGLAKPFHFPVSALYNLFVKQTGKIDDVEDTNVEYCKVESAPNLNTGIAIRNLHKIYGKKPAVNGLTMNIYEGQITALLGHNGAGKTTTMSILTGMIGASSGKVAINGQDLEKNIDEVRNSLGLCPQHNLHFTDLTVLEHLMFFGMLKGLSRKQAQIEAENMLKKLNIHEKRNNMASTLSGGMKRRLSLGIALIGDSKVLILDEPTSGLDPEARREIWDMLLTFRGSRTIVITTHFMEEADVLGDRIAIMDHGRLICYGTSMFLKKEYGTGYHLTVIRDEAAFKTIRTSNSNYIGVDENQVNIITNVIRSQIAEAVLNSDNGNQLTYLLPNESKSQFSSLLFMLEDKKESLGITNISMSVTTLEEVFLRVGNMVAKEERKANNKRNSECSDGSGDSTISSNSQKSTGSELLRQQFCTLVFKRWQVQLKRWKVQFLQILMPFFITFLTLYLGQTSSTISEEIEPRLELDLNVYGKTTVYYGGTDVDNKMDDIYGNFAKQHGAMAEKVGQVSDAIIKKGVENIAYYRQHMIVSAEFNTSTEANTPPKLVNAMYSVTGIHAAPISLNLVTNTILKSLMGNDYSIGTGNAPLPQMQNTFSAQEENEIEAMILWVILFPLGLLFLAGSFILFPQMERVSNIKQLQLMCGVRPYLYWLACYLFDFFWYLTVVVLLIILIAIYGLIGTDTFSVAPALGALFVILFTYGLSSIPYAYLFSYKKTAAGGFATFLITSMVIGVILTTVVLVLEYVNDDYYAKIGKTIKYFALFLPQFGLTYSAAHFSRKAVWNHNWDVKPLEQKTAKCHYEPSLPCCGDENSATCRDYRSYFSGDNYPLTESVIIMAASCVIYTLIMLFLETNFIRKAWDHVLISACQKIYPDKVKVITETDGRRPFGKDDVKMEKDRVCDTMKRVNNRKIREGTDTVDFASDLDLLLVHDLEKIFGGKHKVVNGVTFGVKAGDCFGLLGVNGAGKTTTFRMLTGDETLTNGSVKICESDKTTNIIDIATETKEYLEKVGYCPQFDAINNVLTGREMLRLFANLRGITTTIEQEVKYWIHALGLEEYADKPCGQYSGGNKRKLSIAMALIGHPILVMLDEPTSGVDPAARRKLWDAITELQKQVHKPSIMLTSHSMEECEALCNKLAIMKAGQLECYGTIPHLKQKYGQGFTVLLKLKPLLINIIVNPTNESSSVTSGDTLLRETSLMQDPDEVENLIKDFENKYAGHFTLRDKHSGLLHYHINDTSKRWGELFKEVEELKRTHPIIEDYNISETTLEEVFLSIARSESED